MRNAYSSFFVLFIFSLTSAYSSDSITHKFFTGSTSLSRKWIGFLQSDFRTRREIVSDNISMEHTLGLGGASVVSGSLQREVETFLRKFSLGISHRLNYGETWFHASYNLLQESREAIPTDYSKIARYPSSDNGSTRFFSENIINNRASSGRSSYDYDYDYSYIDGYLAEQTGCHRSYDSLGFGNVEFFAGREFTLSDWIKLTVFAGAAVPSFVTIFEKYKNEEVSFDTTSFVSRDAKEFFLSDNHFLVQSDMLQFSLGLDASFVFLKEDNFSMGMSLAANAIIGTPYSYEAPLIFNEREDVSLLKKTSMRRNFFFDKSGTSSVTQLNQYLPSFASAEVFCDGRIGGQFGIMFDVQYYNLTYTFGTSLIIDGKEQVSSTSIKPANFYHRPEDTLGADEIVSSYKYPYEEGKTKYYNFRPQRRLYGFGDLAIVGHSSLFYTFDNKTQIGLVAENYGDSHPFIGFSYRF